MKKSQLRSIIREEIIYTLKESFNPRQNFIYENDEEDEIAQNIRNVAKYSTEKAKNLAAKEDKPTESILRRIMDDINRANSLEEAKDIIRQFVKDMHIDEDPRYSYEKIMFNQLLNHKYFSQFIKHFYDALLNYEKLGSPDVKKRKGGNYSGGEWGNANPSKSRGGSGDINLDNIVIPKRTK